MLSSIRSTSSTTKTNDLNSLHRQLCLARQQFENGIKNQLNIDDVFKPYEDLLTISVSQNENPTLRYSRAICRLLIINYANLTFDKKKTTESLIINSLQQIHTDHEDIRKLAPQVGLTLSLIHLYGSRYGTIKKNRLRAQAFLRDMPIEYSNRPACTQTLYALFFLIYLELKLGVIDKEQAREGLIKLAKQQYPSPLAEETLLPKGDYEDWLPIGISIILMQPEEGRKKSLQKFNKMYQTIYQEINGNRAPLFELNDTLLVPDNEMIPSQKITIKERRFIPTMKMFTESSAAFKLAVIVAFPTLLSLHFGSRLINHCRRKYRPMHNAEVLYNNGFEKEAFDIYLQAAEQGNTYAMGKAGVILYQSGVIKQNLPLAATYLEKSALAGHTFAQIYWGRYLLVNANDSKKAKPWFTKPAAEGYIKAHIYLAYIHFNENYPLPKYRNENDDMRCHRLFAKYETILKSSPQDMSRYRIGLCLFIKSGILLRDPGKKQLAEQLAIEYITPAYKKNDAHIKLILGLMNLYGSMAKSLPQQNEINTLIYFAGLSQNFTPNNYRACLAKFLYLFINRNNSLINVEAQLHQLAQNYTMPLDTTHYLPTGIIEDWLPLEYKHILQKPTGAFKIALKEFADKFNNKLDEHKQPAEVKQSALVTEPVHTAHEEQPLSASTPKEAQKEQPLPANTPTEAPAIRTTTQKPATESAKKKKRPQANKGGTFKQFFTPQQPVGIINESKQPSATQKKMKQLSRPKSWRDHWKSSLEHKDHEPATLVITDQEEADKKAAAVNELREKLQQKAKAARNTRQVTEQKHPARRMSDGNFVDKLNQWRKSTVNEYANSEINFSAEFSNLLVTAKLAKQSRSGLLLSKLFLTGDSDPQYSCFVASLQLLDGIQTLTTLETNLSRVYKAIQTQQLDRPTRLSHHHYQLILTFFKNKLSALVKSGAGSSIHTKAYLSVVETPQFCGLRKEENLALCESLGIGDESRWITTEMKLTRYFTAKLLNLRLAKQDASGLKLVRSIFANESGGHSDFMDSLLLLDGLNNPTQLQKIFDLIVNRKLDKPVMLAETHYQQLLKSFELKCRYYLMQSTDTSQFSKAYQAAITQGTSHDALNKSICQWLGLDAKYHQTAAVSSRFFSPPHAADDTGAENKQAAANTEILYPTAQNYPETYILYIDPQLYWQYLCQSQAFIPYAQYNYQAQDSIDMSGEIPVPEQATPQRSSDRRNSCHF